METQKKRRGDRKDGRLMRELDSLHYVTGILYPNRCDNEAYISQRIDLTNMNAYIAKKNETETEFPYTMFHLVLAAACVIFFYGTLRLKGILDGLQKIQDMIRINPVYLNTLLKMTGITYIVEFASGICRDAGYAALGTQIEIFGKLSILAVSIPVILALLDTLQGFLA